MVSSVSNPQVAATLANAASAGIISSASQAAIETELDDIALAGCAGVDVDEIDSEEVTLVVVLLDASDSMNPYQAEVLKQYKEQFLEPLKGAKNAESILVSVWAFSRIGEPKDNVRLIHGFTPVPQCPELTDADYQPNGMTPLFDAVFKGITGLVSYGQTLRDNGTRTKSIVVVLSDGWENASLVGQTKVRNLTERLMKLGSLVIIV
jgi:Mg-chelatase subunit ChlD